MKIAGGSDVRSANEPAVDPLVFDPRHQFFPQTLLTAEDLRIPQPRRRNDTSRKALWLVAGGVLLVLLAAGGVAYLYFQPAQVTDSSSATATSPNPTEARPAPSASGSIIPKAAAPAATTAPAPATPAKTVAPAPRSTVTHLRSPDAVAAGAASEPAKAQEPEKRAPVKAPAAEAPRAEPPKPAPKDPRTSDCTEAGKALGLCLTQ